MSKAPKSKGAYKVGYGCPPVHAQFKPGQSGNPAGKRKGQPSFQELIEREAARLVKVKRGDEVEMVPKREVVVRQLWKIAMEGDLNAMRLLLSSSKSGAGAGEEETASTLLTAPPDDEAIRRMLARFQHLQPHGETP